MPAQTRDIPPARRAAFALETAGVRLLQALTRPGPLDATRNAAGRAGAALIPLLAPARKRAYANMALVRPDWDEARRREVLRAMGDNLARLSVEHLRMAELAARPELFEVSGAEHLTRAARAGRGVVLVSAHFGNWEAIRLAARRLGAPSALIYRAFNNPSVDRIVQGMVREAGEPVLHKGRAGSRALLRHVAQGGAALILVDQRQTGAPLLPFLGREAETALAAAELARRFGAALIPARGRRRADGLGFDVAFEEPVPHGAPEAMMAEVNARISDWILRDPGQWFWLHRRWKLRPRGEALRAAARRGGGAGG
ncbi:lysophospholipid acyltransferase family protein [Oceanicella actignis]|uniref:KDO2-lipid IV(A) lauroyltransferase n=1 Tax=Oceanicella actignis TaxID=1189325 RepID=A0A1M7SRC4_9RHOB|nr:lauroyl acyltransferase [Oceanicella actignis]TYO90783.1 KDO2-lipid IV(A) lauroyltransferase [Oceanicella actignis]SES67675.1 KDO2-lipid IV(A) lauroyltransferase [Oceanicella actignis]SHN61045.1 KDO2-lipid IV(A) lauroyltransferase [Oceanicella actignis]